MEFIRIVLLECLTYAQNSNAYSNKIMTVVVNSCGGSFYLILLTVAAGIYLKIFRMLPLVTLSKFILILVHIQRTYLPKFNFEYTCVS